MKKLILLFLAFFVGLFSIFASYPQTDVQKIYDSETYREFIYFMYNSPSEPNLGPEVKSINDFIESSPFDNEAKIITKAQTLQLIGKFLIRNQTSLNGSNGKATTEEGLSDIKKIKNLDNNEEAQIAKANLLGNYMLLSNKYIFSKGKQSSQAIDKAIKINKKNPRSILIDSERMMYAPNLFGGDKEKAKRQLKDLIGNYQLLPKEAFEAVKDLGILAKDEGKYDFARTYFTYANEIFPDNQEIKELWPK
jgi:tetratricopeptide (TPR) repeat protein